MEYRLTANFHLSVYFVYDFQVITNHVLCKPSNGELASLANLKIDYRLFVGMLLVWKKLS